MGRGNIIGKPNLPAATAAGGMWGLREQYTANRADEWPGYDPQWSKTSLLFKTGYATADAFLDSSPNNFTVTKFGDTIQTTATPYAPYWSAHLDGSGDFLSGSSTQAFGFGTGDYTVEAWINPGTGSGSQCIVGGSSGCFAFRLGSSYGGYLTGLQVTRSQVADYDNCSFTFTPGQWYHVAVTRQSGTVRFFVNGVQQTTGNTANSGYNWPNETAFTVGTAATGAGNETYTGHISNVRVVKGTAIYTSSFTVPSSPLTAVTNTSLLTCQSNRFRDNSTNNFTVTRNGDVAVSRFSPFAWEWTAASGGSGYFDGSGDYLSLPLNAALTLGTSDFCIEMWINPVNVSGEKALLDYRYSGGDSSSTNMVTFNLQNGGFPALFSGGAWRITSATAVVPGTWNHVALTRSGTSTRLWLNGTQVGSTYTDTTNYIQGSGSPSIGAVFDGNLPYIGWISNLRIVKGSAIYTAAFTPPTSPVTAIAGTSLLLNFTNAAYRDTSGVVSVMRTFGTPSRGTLAPSSELTSIGFNGSTDYLGWVGNNVMNFGSGNFTVQAWVRLNAMPTSDAWPTNYSSHMVVVECGTYNTGDGCAFIIGATKLIFHSNDTPYLSSGAHGMAVNTWYHIAVRRSGTMLAFFVNGTLIGTTTITGAVGTAGSTFVGCETGQGAFLNGMLSNLKVDRAVALRGTHGSVYFDGAGGDFLSVPNAAANVTNQNYTAEAWVRFTVNNIGYQPIFGNTGTGDAHGWILITETNNYLYAYHSASGGSWNYNIATSYQPSVNVWTHLALVRNGTTVTLYANGTSIGSTSIGTNSVQSPSGAFYAGYYPWFPGGARSLTGNISNLRLVIGTAVYTSNFTPPTQPLAAITNTTLLTAQSPETVTDASIAARTVTRGGDAAPVDLSPFNPTQMFTPPTAPLTSDPTTTLLLSATADFYDATNKHNIAPTATVVNTPVKINGSLANFNGSQIARLWPTTATASNFNFGTGDFTIEAWIYPTSTSSARCIFTTRTGGSNGSAVWFGLQENSYTLGLATTVWVVTANRTVPPNAWSHVVLQRANGVVYLYIDGVPAGSAAWTGDVTNTTAAVGYSVGDNAFGWIGALDEVRVTKGAARYGGAFTPPAIGYSRDWEPDYNDTLSTSNALVVKSIDLPGVTNNIFRDDSANAFGVTRFGDVTQGTFTPYYPTGYWSNFFDGTGDYLTAPSTTALNFGTGDFTVEAWINLNVANGTARAIISGTAVGCFGFRYGTTYNGSTAGLSIYKGNTADCENVAFNFVAGRWYHVAVTRQSGTVRFFVDGVQQTTLGSGYTGYSAPTETNVRIGSSDAATENFNGNISNVRVVKGTALYSASFTPPTAPLTAVSGTTVLTCQDNTFRSNGSTALAFTRTGDVAVSRFDPFPLTVPVTTVATTQPGSVYFDGTGDYLSTTANAAFNFGGGISFTVEGWINPATINTGGSWTGLFSTRDAGTFAPFILGQVDGSVLMYVGAAALNTWFFSGTSSAVLTANAWNHIALVGNGTNIRVYVNGTQVLTCGQPAWASQNYPLLIGFDVAWAAFRGFMSDVRVVRNTAVYTAAFTPPTAPLTAISGTTLLTCQNPSTVTDASTSNVSITRNGDARAIDFSPFQTAKRATYTYGGSGHFDGTGDYLTINGGTAFDFSTGDFCIEGWVNPTAVTGADRCLWDTRAAAGDTGMVVFIDTNAKISTYTSNGIRITSTGSLVANSWQHVALVRSAGVLAVYINGTQSGTLSYATAIGCPGRVSVGVRFDNAALYTGYMAGLRVVKGSPVYTASFTPPTSPPVAISGTSLLLNFDNAGVYDAAGINVLNTVGNTSSSTSIRKYDQTSVAFDSATVGYVNVPAPAPHLALGTGDFTIEFWVYRTVSAQQVFYGHRPLGGNGTYPLIYCEGATLYYYVNSGNQINGGTLAAGSWFHIAVCRAASQTRMFVNGTQVGATYADTNNYLNPTGRPVVGGNDQTLSDYRFAGNIEGLRVSRTARYVTNFTVPAASLPLN